MLARVFIPDWENRTLVNRGRGEHRALDSRRDWCRSELGSRTAGKPTSNGPGQSVTSTAPRTSRRISEWQKGPGGKPAAEFTPGIPSARRRLVLSLLPEFGRWIEV